MPSRPHRADLQAFIAALRDLPREIRAQSRPALQAAAEPIRADAAKRASWSTRIPRALRVTVRFGMRDTGLALTASRTVPHARLYEFGQRSNRRLFRHPTFGNRQAWVSQQTRPFMVPAARTGREDVLRALGEAVDRAARTAGWR
jgi:hypothetical protein